MEFCLRLLILKTLVVLSNFTESCNLIPHLENSGLLVHKNYKSTFYIVILLPLSLIIHAMYFMHFVFLG